MIPHQIVDRYRLLREIGRGGIGTVFEAEDLDLSRHVALKLIQPEHARDRELEDRFLREARALARVPHPSIVRICRNVITSRISWFSHLKKSIVTERTFWYGGTWLPVLRHRQILL